MRFAEHGLSPVKASLIGLVVLIVASYFIFTKAMPFRHHYTVHAVVRSSNLIAPGSPVRIGGVDAGKVTGIGRYRDSNLGELTMQIDRSGRPIGTDATLKIRPRLFLEGNFYVDLSPGSPSTPTLRDGGTIPLSQTANPVQLDQLLDAFPANTRHELQRALQGLGVALDTTPTAAQDAQLDPAVRGLTEGRRSTRRSIRARPRCATRRSTPTLSPGRAATNWPR